MLTTSTAPRAGAKEWAALAVLTLPALLAAMDLSVLFMAAPWLSAELAPTGSQLLWAMDIYGFFMAGLLITMGTLGDRIGRRRLLLLGAVAFGVASVLAAYAPTAELLIAARALLGIGGATLAPSTLALIRNIFHDDAQRRSAVAVWSGAFSAGFPLGAIVGGLLVEHFWWGSVFLINLPVMALLLVLAPYLLPESKDPAAGRFDLLGAAQSIAAVLLVIWALKKLAEDCWSVAAVAAAGAGLSIGYLFIRRQRAAADPLIDIRLFQKPAFSASIGANLALVLASAGLGMLAVQYFQLVLGLRPFVAALWMLPIVGATTVGIAVGTKALRWVRPAVVMGTGLALGATGFWVLTGVRVDGGVATVLPGYCVLSLGMGMVLALAVNLVMVTAPPERAGAAAAVSETASEFGGALGIATLGSIAAAVYRSELDPTRASGLAPEQVEAANGSLGGAAAVVEQLPDAVAGELLRDAREAFVQGLSVTAAVGACLLAVVAVLVPIALRRVRLPELAATETGVLDPSDADG